MRAQTHLDRERG